jgi:hypothetical protein
VARAFLLEVFHVKKGSQLPDSPSFPASANHLRK